MEHIFTSYHVGVAAEAIVAAQFARLNFDISVQYGANQPGYDLIVSKKEYENPYRISVKGSKDGSWGLAQNFMEKDKANYQEAINKWYEKHNKKIIFILVQFFNSNIE